jgi:hypothetical protein
MRVSTGASKLLLLGVAAAGAACKPGSPAEVAPGVSAARRPTVSARGTTPSDEVLCALWPTSLDDSRVTQPEWCVKLDEDRSQHCREARIASAPNEDSTDCFAGLMRLADAPECSTQLTRALCSAFWSSHIKCGEQRITPLAADPAGSFQLLVRDNVGSVPLVGVVGVAVDGMGVLVTRVGATKQTPSQGDVLASFRGTLDPGPHSIQTFVRLYPSDSFDGVGAGSEMCVAVRDGAPLTVAVILEDSKERIGFAAPVVTRLQAE